MKTRNRPSARAFAEIVWQLGNEWRTAGVGNYDGDGDFDWFVRRDDGSQQILEFENGRIKSVVDLGFLGLEWSVV